MGKWPSGHGQLTKIRLSAGCGGKTITTAAQFEYDRHGFEGYLGNVGLEVIWEMSVKIPRGTKRILAAALFAVLLSNPGVAADVLRRVLVTNAEQLDDAVRAAQPGDLILIAPGRYRTKLRFTAQNSGTKFAPVIVTARDGLGTVVIDGAGADITVKFSAAAHVQIKALDITGGGYHGVFFDNGTHNIVVDGSRIYDNHGRRPLNSHAELKGSGGRARPHQIAITNNEIFHTRHPPGGNFQGIDCNFCDDFLIASNYLHDIREPTSEPYSHYDRGSCIQMKSTTQNTMIERNRIARCHIGIVLGGEGLASPENIGGIVRNNLIYDSGEIGIAIVNATGGKVTHNTLVRNGEAIRVARDGRYPESQNQVDIMNNILNGPIRAITKQKGAIKGNYFLETDMAAHVFRNPSARDFRLKATAFALIDQAVDMQSKVSDDYDGTFRPQGAGADIGAFEYRP